MTLESLIIQFSYVAILLLLIANSFIPYISSQVIYIVSGYFASTGSLNLWLVLIAGTLGNMIGNVALYELARSKGVKYISKWKLFPIKELKKTQIAFKKKGTWFVIIGKLLPYAKIFVPIVAGISKMNRILYAVIIIITSFIWASIFTSLGFFFGKGATSLFKAYVPILALLALIVIWLFYQYMNSEEVLKEMKR